MMLKKENQKRKTQRAKGTNKRIKQFYFKFIYIKKGMVMIMDNNNIINNNRNKSRE